MNSQGKIGRSEEIKLTLYSWQNNTLPTYNRSHFLLPEPNTLPSASSSVFVKVHIFQRRVLVHEGHHRMIWESLTVYCDVAAIFANSSCCNAFLKYTGKFHPEYNNDKLNVGWKQYPSQKTPWFCPSGILPTKVLPNTFVLADWMSKRNVAVPYQRTTSDLYHLLN